MRTALLSDLKKTTGLPLIPVKVRGSKEVRAEAITPLFESDRCLMPPPENVPLIGDFITEHLAFPAGRHDDMVDASTLALTRIRESRSYVQHASGAYEARGRMGLL